MVGLGGTLEMFELNREIADYVHGNKGPAPDDADIRALDSTYARFIRPVLDELEPTLGPLASGLFRSSSGSSYVAFGEKKYVQGSVLDSHSWEQTKSRYIVSEGFKLSRTKPLELKHVYTFRDYSGKGGQGFDVALSIAWLLDGELLTRSVAIDGSHIPSLEVTVAYEELDGANAAVDQMIAEIGGRVIRRIR